MMNSNEWNRVFVDKNEKNAGGSGFWQSNRLECHLQRRLSF